MRAKYFSLGFLGTAVICSAATLVVLAGRNTNGPGETKPAATEVAVSVQRPSETGPIRMVRFVLFEAGIYPRALTVEKGLVNVALEDKTNSTAGLRTERAFVLVPAVR